MDDVTKIADLIKEMNMDIFIAGHMPHLGKLVSLLVVGDPLVPVVDFQQGSVVCLEKNEIDRWSVIWVLTPEIFSPQSFS